MGLTPDQEKAIFELYTEMYPAMVRYACAVTGERNCAEEAVQEPFRIACSRPDAVLGSPRPVGWLMLTLKDELRELLRLDFEYHDEAAGAYMTEIPSPISPRSSPGVSPLSTLSSRPPWRILR